MDTQAEHLSAGPARRLTCRDRAILRAVAGGSAEIVVGAEPDLFLDGRCCSDQMAAHRLVNAGLITAAVPGAVGQRVAARLTPVGRELVVPPAEQATRPEAVLVERRRAPAIATVRPARHVESRRVESRPGGALAAIA
jgi:hypothetical protein